MDGRNHALAARSTSITCRPGSNLYGSGPRNSIFGSRPVRSSLNRWVLALSQENFRHGELTKLPATKHHHSSAPVARDRAGILLNEHISQDGPTVSAFGCQLGAEGIVSKRVDGLEALSARSPTGVGPSAGRGLLVRWGQLRLVAISAGQMDAEAHRLFKPIVDALKNALGTAAVFELMIPANALQGRKMPLVRHVQQAGDCRRDVRAAGDGPVGQARRSVSCRFMRRTVACVADPDRRQILF
jgi:hypothetical protein